MNKHIEEYYQEQLRRDAPKMFTFTPKSKFDVCMCHPPTKAYVITVQLDGSSNEAYVNSCIESDLLEVCSHCLKTWKDH